MTDPSPATEAREWLERITDEAIYKWSRIVTSSHPSEILSIQSATLATIIARAREVPTPHTHDFRCVCGERQ